jgi:hypothetical protein
MDASGDVIGVDGHTEAGSGLTTITVLNAMGASLVSFPIGASGNVAPTSVITGSSTNIDNASALAADAEGNLYVSTELAILVFPPGATGNVTAARTIAGPNALATTDGFVSVAVAPDGTIYAASELQSGTNRAPQILVFPAGSNGNVAPSATIAGSSTTMQAVLAMGVSTQVAEADATQNILFFDTTDTGNVAPQHTLSLGAGLVEGLAFGPSNDLSLAIWDFSASSVVTYAAGAQGTDTPIATLTGVSTTITNAGGVAVDASGEIYVTSADGTTASISVFTPNATGDVAPTRTITGSATMLSGDASQYPMPIVVVARVTD